MAINARVQITSDTRFISWSSANTQWDGVIIRVYYPTAGAGETQQTFTNNPPSIGDYIIDEAGKIWKITAVNSSWTPKTSNYHWYVSIQVQNRVKSDEVEPELGATTYGSICTPVNNALNPWFDSKLVTSSIARLAMQFNIEEETMGGGGTGTGDANLDGTTEITGTIVPSASGTFSLGSEARPFDAIYTNDMYVGPSSLYVNGKKVIEDISDTITIATDANQDLLIKTTGTGDITFDSENTIVNNSQGGIQYNVPSTKNSKHIAFSNSSITGNITFVASGSSGQVQFNANSEIDLTAPVIDMNGNADVSGNLVVGGNLTINGVTTTIDTTNLSIQDNEIVLNSGQTGSAGVGGGTGTSGFRVHRGDLSPALFYFDEADDKFKCGIQGGSLVTVGQGEVNQNALYSIAVSGQTTVAADSAQQSVSFIAGSNMAILTDNTNKTITFTASAGGGQSVFNAPNTTYTISGSEVVLCSYAGNQTVILPAPSAGRKVDIKKISSSGIVTIQTPESETIDGSADDKLLSIQYENITLISDGVNWFIL